MARLSEHSELPSRGILFIKVGATFLVLYLTTNRFQLFVPRLVPPTEIDALVPFAPGWVYAYLFTYPFVMLPVLLLDVRLVARSYLPAFAAIAALSALVFVVFPTTLNRALYPIPAHEGFAAWALGALRHLDLPTNCLPSMHVSLSFLTTATFAIATRRRSLRIALTVLFAAICYSTLATKQHYALDVLGGLGMGLIGSIYYYSRELHAASALQGHSLTKPILRS